MNEVLYEILILLLQTVYMNALSVCYRLLLLRDDQCLRPATSLTQSVHPAFMAKR